MAVVAATLAERAAYGLGASALTADEISINVSFGSGKFYFALSPSLIISAGTGSV
jgi:hypothetical protein